MSVTQARRLRRSLSPPEATLWNVLRIRPNGLKFRRQRPSDPFVLDFFCRAALLAIEIDGLAHEFGDRSKKDEWRDRMMAGRSVKTIRIAAEDVKLNLDGVIRYILEECAQRTPPPAFAGPPPQQLLGRI